jgi:undecaprenyl-diphosphatase
MTTLLSTLDAAILGVVEGLTEFLPVSSTGHLILASTWLGLYQDPSVKAGVDAFEIVIQSGALLAVIGLYAPHVRAMARGLVGRDVNGLRLFLLLLAGFFPAAVIGLLAGSWIKGHLFGIGPVIGALALGGVVMIAIERWEGRREEKHSANTGKPMAEMTVPGAITIGFAQCLAMWPGTSRSMVTIMAARLLGFQPKAAAEFSFLLALPTLGAASAYELLHQGPILLQTVALPQLLVGLSVSCLVAWLAIKGFLAYLNRHGMEAFGWYRLVLALALFMLFTPEF